ncbi:MAG: metallophosphoesterase [Sedimentisphaerales bacterium]|nr:metallophosphoesterase [Sedimentisphaerales bacterium]
MKEELIVISDLHLSDGYDKNSERYSRNEDFFFDEEFKRLLEYLQTANAHKKHLIIAGDMFDFLQVDPDGDKIDEYSEFFKKEHEKKSISSGTDEIKQDVTQRERTYGLGTGKTKTVWKLGQIVNGHRVFFEALAHFLSNDNSLSIIPGNHDIEFHWEEVQNALREYIADLFENTSLTEQQQQEKKESIKTRIEFCSWFYYNKKLKVYIEHGNQYDRLNSFEYFLYPRLEEDSDMLWLPFGSFFVRYFFNKLESSHPFADNIKPITKYAEWAWSEHKLELLKNIWRHVPTMYQLFKKRKKFSKTDRLNDLNEDKLDKLSKELGQPLDAIKEINRLRADPLTRSRLSILLFFAGTIFFFFSLIALVVLIVLRIFYKFSLWTFLSPLAFLSVPIVKWVYRKFFQKDFFEQNITKIQKIKENLKDVQIIVFGHTHDPDIRIVTSDCKYFNIGTWTTVFSEEERILREAKQFAFLWIKEDNGKPHATLFRWNDYLKEPERLKLFKRKP